MNTLIFIVLLVFTIILAFITIYFAFWLEKTDENKNISYYLQIAQVLVLFCIFTTIVYGWFFKEDQSLVYNRTYTGLKS